MDECSQEKIEFLEKVAQNLAEIPVPIAEYAIASILALSGF